MKRILAMIRRVWSRYPDRRIGQLLESGAWFPSEQNLDPETFEPTVFHLTEDETTKARLEKTLKGMALETGPAAPACPLWSPT